MTDLPPGSLVHAEPVSGGPPRPVLWVTDEEAPDADLLWESLYEDHQHTGLYPLLLIPPDDEEPWYLSGHRYRPTEWIDELDVESVFRAWWSAVTVPPDEDSEEPLTGPWPGLAAPGTEAWPPDAQAVARAEALTIGRDLVVGLVPAKRGADALTVLGWQGPLHHTPRTEEISAALRSWEDRFGARVVMLDACLYLSVAAPPTTLAHAQAVAIEHYAFCPDNIDQSGGTFQDYARSLINAEEWTFWWD